MDKSVPNIKKSVRSSTSIRSASPFINALYNDKVDIFDDPVYPRTNPWKGEDPMLRILDTQGNWTERKGFSLERPEGMPFYIIAQYLTGIELCIDGETRQAPPGSILILEPGVPHAYYCTEDLLHHWFHVEGPLQPLLEKYGLQPNRLYQLGNADELSVIFQQIALAYHDKGLYRQDYMALKLQELLVCMGTQLNFQSRADNLDYNVILRLKELRRRILEHPEYDWSVAEMARQMYLSESYFSPLYRKCFGITPNRDLIGIRIERARTNLICGCSVAAAAEKSGYSNVYHFIRQFKKVTGITPNQYKLQNKDFSPHPDR